MLYTNVYYVHYITQLLLVVLFCTYVPSEMCAYDGTMHVQTPLSLISKKTNFSKK